MRKVGETLTSAKKLLIVKLYKVDRHKQKYIAAKFGISQSVVSRIVNDKYPTSHYLKSREIAQMSSLTPVKKKKLFAALFPTIPNRAGVILLTKAAIIDYFVLINDRSVIVKNYLKDHHDY
jgi:hypothetical protein